MNHIVRASLVALALSLPAAAQPSAGGGGESSASSGNGAPAEAVETIEALGEAAVQAAKGGAATVDDPEHDSTASPRKTLLTFRENMRYVGEGRLEAWPRVLKTLAEPEAFGEDQLKQAAIALDKVFDRFGEISPSVLPGEEAIRATGVGRVEVFPGELDHATLWEQAGGAPDGEIVLSRATSGAWQFEVGTVAGATALLESIRDVPPQSSKKGDEVLQRVKAIVRPTWQDTPWWGWLAATGCVVGGAVVGLLIGKVFGKVAARADDRGYPLVGRIVGEIGPVLGLTTFAIAVVVGSGFITFGPTLSQWRWNAAKVLALIVIGYGVFKLAGIVGALIASRAERGRDDSAKTIVPFVVEAVRFTIALVFVAVLLQSLLGLSAGALLTSFGAVGLAVGLAAKESVRNWIGAMTIFLAKPFAVDDWIIFEKEFGQVERVALNATHIRTVKGEVMVVPNMKFIDGIVQNANRRQFLRRTMKIAIPYDTSPDRVDEAVQVVKDVLNSDEVREAGKYDAVGKEPHVTFQAFNEDHLEIRAYYWFHIPPSEAGWYQFLDHNDLVNRRLFKAFEDRGLSFAFPTQTLRLTDDSERGFTLNLNGHEATEETARSN